MTSCFNHMNQVAINSEILKKMTELISGFVLASNGKLSDILFHKTN